MCFYLYVCTPVHVGVFIGGTKGTLPPFKSFFPELILLYLVAACIQLSIEVLFHVCILFYENLDFAHLYFLENP